MTATQRPINFNVADIASEEERARMTGLARAALDKGYERGYAAGVAACADYWFGPEEPRTKESLARSRVGRAFARTRASSRELLEQAIDELAAGGPALAAMLKTVSTIETSSNRVAAAVQAPKSTTRKIVRDAKNQIVAIEDEQT